VRLWGLTGSVRRVLALDRQVFRTRVCFRSFANRLAGLQPRTNATRKAIYHSPNPRSLAHQLVVDRIGTDEHVPASAALDFVCHFVRTAGEA
jgi:hypothetical protein